MSDLVFGFDPSLTHFGWCVAEHSARDGLRLIDAGVWTTKPVVDDDTKTEGYARRCEFLASRLFGLIEAFGRPASLACEAVALPFGRTSMQTVSALGRVRGLIDALAASQSLTVTEFQPAQLKRLVTGDKSASKRGVIDAVLAAYPEAADIFASIKPSDVEHAADAAAALHAAHLNPTKEIHP